MALASVADWVASDPSFFPYGRDPMDRKYWFGAQERAKKALDAIGWRRFWRPPHRSFQELFGFAPNPLQEATARLLSGRIEEPLFLLVEAPMGMGKTEAALYAHHLLQQSLEHRGLYMALPTQATGSGLFPRVRAFLERVSSGVPLDLQLQHGTALLNPVYVSLLEKACPEQVGEREEGPLASSWFSARKRAMLSPHGVGTLDQALLGVLRVKHHFIRLWGLMNRVVILDEVHAYDVYTSGLLLALLRWLKALGSSAIVMTATLPSRRRRELLRAWSGDGSETLALGPYPRLLAAFGGGNFRAEPLPPVRAVEVALERVPVEVEKVASRLLSSLPGTLGAIVNTVERAQSLYRALGEGEPLTLREVVAGMEPGPGNGTWKELAEALDEKGDWVVGKRLGDGTLVFLLHARFPAEERALREAVVLILFGKEGLRPSRAVLVATQVAEQSLDLDFDLLYSDLAPIDLLFQRAGRLHRHDRERPPLHETPRLLLGLPEALAFGSPLHWSRIYEEFVLLATCLALEGRERLKIPQDLEALLEAVYEASPRAFPEPIRTQAEKSYARLEERFTREEELARKLSLSQLEKLLAYGDEADLVAELRLEDDEERPETQRLLTRLGDPSVAVVPVYRMGEGVFLDRERRRRAPLDGEIGREEAELLFRRGVRLSRYPLPQMLLKEETPTAWRKSGLLRGLRPLFLDRVFGEGRDAFQVELDPELGVVYRLVRSRHGLTD
jgi:CRISPR-associated endonuclease/helicase Cas3